MIYRGTNIKPDKTSTVQMDQSLYDKFFKFLKSQNKRSDRHIFASEIIRDAVTLKIGKIDLKKKRLKKKPKYDKRVNFTLTNDLWRQLKLCAEQTAKSQNEFTRDAIKEFLEIN